MFVRIADTFAIGLEGIPTTSTLAYILEEYSHCISSECSQLPLVGRVCIVPKLTLPADAVELRKGILYEHDTSLFIHTGFSALQLTLDEQTFHLVIGQKADPAIAFFTLEMLIRLYAPLYGLVFMHAGAFAYHDKVCVLNAFGGVGKTEVMLKALEHGATFISDDFAIFNAHGEVFPYTKRIYLCEYPYDAYMLAKAQRSKMLYCLKTWCEQLNGFFSRRIAQRLEAHYFGIKVDYSQLSGVEAPNRFLPIDSFYWVDNSNHTGQKNISKEYFSRRMKLCLDIESRRYFDYDGYLRLKYPFLELHKEMQSAIIDELSSHLRVQGLTIHGRDFDGLANLVMKLND